MTNKTQLGLYYNSFFPFGPIFRWFSHGNDPEKRELAFVVGETASDEVFIRYKAYENEALFRSAFINLCPFRMEIGPFYNHKLKKNAKDYFGLVAEEHELVFDIDMDDYGTSRKCCEGANICNKCWPLMTHAVKVLDDILRLDFGFKHILFVFSGRRGVHCWVCDKRAKVLSEEVRKSIVLYITKVAGGVMEPCKRVELNRPLHSSVARAFKTLEPFFAEEYAHTQGLFSHEHLPEVASFFYDENITETLMKTKDVSWNTIKQTAGTLKISSVIDANIVLYYTYPRLDANVSKSINHLLKSPFCVHPKTGKICVPIPVEDCLNFDVELVPTLEQLEQQNEEATERLNSAINYFERFVKSLAEDEIQTKPTEEKNNTKEVEMEMEMEMEEEK